MVKLVMRVARVAPKRARCFNSKGTSFHVVLELEHVKPVDQRSAIRKADAVLPAFARAGQRHDTLKRVAQRGRCRLLYLFGVKHVMLSSRQPIEEEPQRPHDALLPPLVAHLVALTLDDRWVHLASVGLMWAVVSVGMCRHV